MLTIAASIATVGLVFLLLQAFLSLILRRHDERAMRLNARIARLDGARPDSVRLSVLRRSTMSDIPVMHRLLSRFALATKLRMLVEQSGVQTTAGLILLLAAALAAAAYIAVSWASSVYGAPHVAAAVSGMFPIIYLFHRRARRIAAFESQFPEALDLMVRSLKAGHAFNTSVQVITQDFGDPIGTEFRKVLDEVNFGMGMAQALENMRRRVGSPVLGFFIVSVNIQRESGGNLTEILSTISRLLRERFAFKRQVKSLSAQGRISAYVLVGLPFFVGGMLYMINPEYMRELPGHPIGRLVLVGAFMSMVMGTLLIRKIVRIEV